MNWPRIHSWLQAICTGVLVFSWVGATGLAAKEPDRQPTVQLTVDYGDGVQVSFTQLPWTEAMTVHDLLKSASEHPRGIDFDIRGRSSTALLVQIDGLKNERGRGSNWIYWVNKKMGDRSFAVKELMPSDHVLWRFGEYE